VVEDLALDCRSTDGLDLEAVVSEPEQPSRVFVLCHPHPQMGGTMNAPLLLALRDKLVSEGWAVLRFNFRGIGKSEGEPGDGIAEVADAEGAVASARERWPGLPIAIGGWSFGAAVALRVAARVEGLLACAVIAPAVVARAGITAGVPSPADIDLRAPVLVICGANDKQVPPEECRSWAAAVGADYAEVPGANHFFWAKYDQLAGILSDWLMEKAGT
jgi:alpha/beta superfamily hydrolase